MHTEYIIRPVPGYGFLPILMIAGRGEVYRGEFAPTPEVALARILLAQTRYAEGMVS